MSNKALDPAGLSLQRLTALYVSHTPQTYTLISKLFTVYTIAGEEMENMKYKSIWNRKIRYLPLLAPFIRDE